MRASKSPVGLTPEAERERMRFIVAFEENLRRAQKISLSILVWGPDPRRDSPAARKRKELRDRLIELGHNAMFSEDLARAPDPTSQKTFEFAQARSAHLILILVEDSPGALGEAHDFCNHPELAPKIFILIPSRYRKGYSAQGAIRDLENAYGGVFWYSEKDLTVCNVSSRAISRAEALRQLHFRAQPTV